MKLITEPGAVATARNLRIVTSEMQTLVRAVATGFASKVRNWNDLVNGMKDLFLGLRSRREHKAWGVSPRKLWFSSKSPRKRAKDSRNKGLSPVVTSCDR
jgi:hypothetical protein